MKKLFRHIVLLMAAWLVYLPSQGQVTDPDRYDQRETRILFILDASFSMYGLLGSITKMQAARNIMRDVALRMSTEENSLMALRVFGHQTPQRFEDCRDSKLEVGFRSNNSERMMETIDGIVPNGITPIAYSIGKSARDFGSLPGTRNIVILITDGFESCEANACEVSLELQRKGVIITPYIVGLQVEESRKDELECIGNYFDVYTVEEMGVTMNKILDRIINTTYTKVHLNDSEGNPTESDVNMTFYNSATQTAEYNFYHTINNRGEPDTLFLEPSIVYDLVVHTNPPLSLDDISIAPDTTNIIPMDAAQGFLRIAATDPSGSQKINALVKPMGTNRTLIAHRENDLHKYLVGEYDVEILTLPRIHLSGVAVSQSKTTTITIPNPGVANLKRSKPIYGEIYVLEEGAEAAIYRLNNSQLNESVQLQPGNYKVVYREKTKVKMMDTKTKTFSIAPGTTTTLNL